MLAKEIDSKGKKVDIRFYFKHETQALQSMNTFSKTANTTVRTTETLVLIVFTSPPQISKLICSVIQSCTFTSIFFSVFL